MGDKRFDVPARSEVLVVDDDPAIRSLVAFTLRRRGYAVQEAGGGEECLERLRAGFKGLVLMDIVMPGMDGWETIRVMAQEGLERGSFICMLTGVREPGAAAEGLEEYVMDYLTKPIGVEALVEVAKRASECLSL